jgi:arsenite-transporting ATPase
MQRHEDLLLNAARRLTNSTECTFVCVLSPEFPPLCETERLIQFLDDNEIECHVLVVNQVMGEATPDLCGLCRERCAMQQRYISDIHASYREFQIVEVLVQPDEVKGLSSVRHFSGAMSALFAVSNE